MRQLHRMHGDIQLYDLIGASARRVPRRIAVKIGQHRFTYAEVDRHVARMTSWMWHNGIRRGDYVGISGDTMYLSRVALLSTLKLGAVSVTVSRDNVAVAGRIAPLKWLLASFDDERFPEIQGAAVLRLRDTIIESDLAESGIPPDLETRAGASRLFLSSGTTGQAKGVLVDTALSAARVNAYRSRFAIDEDSRVFAMIGPSTNPGYYALLATFLSGGTVILSGGRTAQDSWDAVGQSTHVVTSPAALKALTEQVRRPSPRSNGDGPTFFVGGSAMPLNLSDEIRTRFGGKVHVIYGSTEVGATCLGDAGLLEVSPSAVGRPGPNVDIEIVDRADRSVARGVSGHVRVRAPTMVHEYLGDSAASSKAFRGGWFYPGDVGSLTDDGVLYVHGRSDDILNIGGTKIFPAAVEAEVLEVEGALDACAMTLMGPNGLPCLTIAIAVGQGADWNAVAAKVSNALARFRAVRVVAVSEIPRNAMGKVARAEFTAWVKQNLENEART